MLKPTCQKEIAEQDKKETKKPEIKIEAFQARLEVLEITFIEIKNNLYDIMKETQEEFINQQKIEKQETIKSILKEFTIYYKNKEQEIQEMLIDIHKKLAFQETLLESLMKEINEQKKQFKDVALKLDLCVKHFNEQTKNSLLKVEKEGYTNVHEKFRVILKTIEVL